MQDVGSAPRSRAKVPTEKSSLLVPSLSRCAPADIIQNVARLRDDLLLAHQSCALIIKLKTLLKEEEEEEEEGKGRRRLTLYQFPSTEERP